MKKSLLFILLVFVCQLTMVAQNIDKKAWKNMYSAQKSMSKVYYPSDWQKVIKKLQKALVYAPNHPFIIYNLGISYDAMGSLDANNYQKAIAYYRQFLASNPSDEDIKEVLGRIYRVELIIQSMYGYSTADVYVAGYEGKVATLWKNGKKIPLSDGKHDACAASVYVTDKNFYVAGYERNEKNYYVANLWKNGNVERLTDGRSHGNGNSVFVHNDNIYVAGFDDCPRVLWKNGKKQNISEFRHIYSVHISNGDIYLVGESHNLGAGLWKNGYFQTLTRVDDKRNSQATSVFVYGEDVYVAGYEGGFIGNPVALLWKNGVPQVLTTEEYYYDYHRPSDSKRAHSVFVSGNDVYVAGEGRKYGGESFAVLWKNGIPIHLSEIESGAQSVYVLGANVYVAGYIMNNKKKVAVMWINGRMQRLGSGNSESNALSIFVK